MALRINRSVLQTALESLRPGAQGKFVLDAGCGDRPFWPLLQGTFYVGSDIDATVRPTVIADNARLPFAPGTFDLVLASETLEHTLHCDEAVSELIRVTKPGGYLFVSVPFMYPIHGAPFDFHRFTEMHLARLFESCEMVEFVASNSAFSGWLLMLESSTQTILSGSPVRFVLPLLSLLINAFALVLDLVMPRLVILLIRLLHRDVRYPSGSQKGLPLALASAPSGYALLARRPQQGEIPSRAAIRE